MKTILEVVFITAQKVQSLLKDSKELLKIYLKNLFLRTGEAKCVDKINSVTKKQNNTKHASTKLTPSQESLNKNEGFFAKVLKQGGKKTKT